MSSEKGGVQPKIRAGTKNFSRKRRSMAPCQIPQIIIISHYQVILIKHMYVNLGTLTLHHVLITEISMSTCIHVLSKEQSRLVVLLDSCLPYSSDRIFYWSSKHFRACIYLLPLHDQAVSIPISLIVEGGEIFLCNMEPRFLPILLYLGMRPQN